MTAAELPLETAKDDKEEETASVAADRGTSASLSELVGIFTFKEKQREGSEGFSLLYAQLVLVRVFCSTPQHIMASITACINLKTHAVTNSVT